MEQRINIQNLAPGFYDAMYAMEKYMQTTLLSGKEKELIKIRASQINHCAYCINMHTADALKYGEDAKRIFLLDAWRETNVFTEEEKVLLELTEAITLIHGQGVPDDLYKRAATVLGETKLAQVMAAVIIINAWNRIAIATTMGFEVTI